MVTFQIQIILNDTPNPSSSSCRILVNSFQVISWLHFIVIYLSTNFLKNRMDSTSIFGSWRWRSFVEASLWTLFICGLVQCYKSKRINQHKPSTISNDVAFLTASRPQRWSPPIERHRQLHLEKRIGRRAAMAHRERCNFSPDERSFLTLRRDPRRYWFLFIFCNVHSI